MRVTAHTFTQTLLNQIGQIGVRQGRLQNQAATGQRVQLPEDDPSSFRRALDLQGESQSIAQYRDNINRLSEQAGATYNAMKGLKRISDRAGEIAILADAGKSQEELDAYATEVAQLLHQAVQVSNSKHQDYFLFSGSASNQKPFTATLDANGRVTAVSYNGNASVPEAEIAENAPIATLIPGVNNSGSGPRGLLSDSRYGADFFNHLISLQDHLLAGDTASIAASDRSALSKDEDSILHHYGSNGAIQGRLEASSNLLENRSKSINGLLSEEVDADLAETLVRLNETQNAYRAALQSGGTIMELSLLDFLR